ncbi:MAG: hypothetical protein PUC62_05715 [Oscillospiraceae bacterium]|nr:hypothetical protein [Oscillospiraceae bacterium]
MDFSYFEQKQGENFVKITRQKTAFAAKNYISETKKRLPQHLVAVSFFAQKRNRTNVLKWEKMLEKSGKNSPKGLKIHENFFLLFAKESRILKALSGAKW